MDTELSTSGKHPKNSRIRVNPDSWLIPESLRGNTLKKMMREMTLHSDCYPQLTNITAL